MRAVVRSAAPRGSTVESIDEPAAQHGPPVVGLAPVASHHQQLVVARLNGCGERYVGAAAAGVERPPADPATVVPNAPQLIDDSAPASEACGAQPDASPAVDLAHVRLAVGGRGAADAPKRRLRVGFAARVA